MNLLRSSLPSRCLPRRLLLLKLVWTVSVAVSAAAEPQAPAAEAELFFEQAIRPVLVSKCIQCHGEAKQEGGLRLDSLAAVLQGGDSGPAIEAHHPDSSLLIEALKYESYEMPPSGPLSARTIAQFETWIAGGAVWPEADRTLRPESGLISDEDRQWWAFQPLVKPQPPQVQSPQWVRNPIDGFVLARLEQAQMRPAPPADRSQLVRRLYFDLLGVPPSPQDIQRFAADNRPDAWERLIEQLLDDPRYGEHWGRHWLDVVRYSESDGWNQDAYRPEIWRYRDYVVEAFNSDKPYPEFVRQQLAGDELAEDDPEARIAAGFLRLGIYEYNQRDARGLWNDILNEMTDVVADVFLGVSMACARCHDHKFDPLPQRDYYQLRAFFEPLLWRDDVDGATAQQRREHDQQLALWEAATADIRRQIEQLVAPYNTRKWASTVDKFPLDIQACFHTPAEQRDSWQQQMAYLVSRQFLEEGGGPLKSLRPEDRKQLDRLEAELSAWDELKPLPLPQIMTVGNHTGRLTPTTLPSDDQHIVDPGFLSVLSDCPLPTYQLVAAPALSPDRSPPDRSPPDRSPPVNGAVDSGTRLVSTARPASGAPTARRLQLAQWISHPDNPLTTRVIVNRIWQQHFGQGLVATSNDFGRLGSPPSHPELLDWLTVTFIEQGWSFKKLHKQILMSATWQQSAQHPQAAQYELRDPQDQLLWRSRVRRLQAEQIRDAMLQASGELQTTLGGPSVDEDQPRRGLYVKNFRNNQDTFLHTFDMANGLKSVAVRDTTTTPMQALLLFNGNYALQRAEQMQRRILQAVGPDPVRVVQLACLSTWGREPTAEELAASLEYLLPDQPLNAQRVTDFCHLLLNSNEFLYVN